MASISRRSNSLSYPDRRLRRQFASHHRLEKRRQQAEVLFSVHAVCVERTNAAQSAFRLPPLCNQHAVAQGDEATDEVGVACQHAREGAHAFGSW